MHATEWAKMQMPKDRF